MPLSYNEDGCLRFGNSIMLACKHTNGTLVMNMAESIVSVEESYAVNTTQDSIGPCARSVFTVIKVYGD